jgi:hypothetical protein
MERWYVTALLALAAVIFLIAGTILDPNEYSLHGFYRDRLVRCYLGASNADTGAGFDLEHPPTICRSSRYATAVKGAMWRAVSHRQHRGQSVRQQRLQRATTALRQLHVHAAGCGSWATNYAATPPRLYLGTALAISAPPFPPTPVLRRDGAAIAALMTFFNMRLGFWFGNSRLRLCNRANARRSRRNICSPKASATNEDLPFVNLVRRRTLRQSGVV